MAKADITMPEKFLLKISRLGERTDEVTKKVLMAGANVMLPVVKSNLQSVIGKDLKTKKRSTGEPRKRSTGELVRAIGISPVKHNSNGDSNVKIGFSEPRSDGGVNAKIANILEFGKKDQSQSAKPFLEPGKKQTRGACRKAMKETLEKEIGQK